VIFSDGQYPVAVQGKSLRQVLTAAVETKIPVFLIPHQPWPELREVVPDIIGPGRRSDRGRFFLPRPKTRWCRDLRIDGVVRTITVKSYGDPPPGFTPFAALAAGLWRCLAADVEPAAVHYISHEDKE